MTAEIAIMNSLAVALAADSAVTVTTGDRIGKIFNGANKIFELSRGNPIGIMIYGNAALNDVPWETVVKMYRKRLGTRRFDTTAAYARDFVSYIEKNRLVFPARAQKRFFSARVGSYLNYVMKNIIDDIEAAIERDGRISEREIAQAADAQIKAEHARWSSAPMAARTPAGHAKKITQVYAKEIREAIREQFEDLPMSKSSVRRLHEIAGLMFERFPEGHNEPWLSGIVVAGFGELEIYPAVCSYEITGIAANRVHMRIADEDAVAESQLAVIAPFAQRDMVSTFMEGVSPQYQAEVESCIAQLVELLPDAAIAELKTRMRVPGVHHEAVREAMAGRRETTVETILDGLRDFRAAHTVDPVLRVVETLPIGELAAMAETMINLASFQKRVSMTDETVGGASDVAVISKGDGFIWIRRKHYFEAGLNPRVAAAALKGE